MAVVALMLTLAGVGFISTARADSGTIAFQVIKGGWIIGASGGQWHAVFPWPALSDIARRLERRLRVWRLGDELPRHSQ